MFTSNTGNTLPIELVAGRYGIPLRELKRAVQAGAVKAQEYRLGIIKSYLIPSEVAVLIPQYYVPGKGIMPHPCLRGKPEVNPADASAQMASRDSKAKRESGDRLPFLPIGEAD